MLSPTEKQYENYQWMFDFFNKELFQAKLPTCLLVLSTSRGNVAGHFARGKWERTSQKVHEININPSFLSTATDMEIASVLVHEMVHLKQALFGSSGTGGYHNKEWARYMEQIGLMPSKTGKPGGQKTGFKMYHYVIKGGVFENAFNKMPKSMFLPFKTQLAIQQNKRRKAKDKLKYSCANCDSKLWGKPGLTPICGNCLIPMKSNDEDTLDIKLDESKMETVRIILLFLNTMRNSGVHKDEVAFYFVDGLIQNLFEEENKKTQETKLRILHKLSVTLDEWRQKGSLHDFIHGRNILN